MTETPFISVVIPHLNQPEALARCLKSIRNQSYPADRFEIIVSDNGSAHLPTDTMAAFPGVRLVEEPTPGPGPARNRGVADSTGGILAFIDADCVADPHWLASIAGALTAPGAPAIIGGDVRVGFADQRRPTMLEAYENIFAYRQKMYIAREGFSGTGNLAVRRETYDLVGPFAGIEVAEDRDWGRRAKAKGLRVTYVPEMIIFHPARTSLGELRDKWARMISHDYEDWRRAGRGKLAWSMRAIAVVASLLRDVPSVFASRRISGLKARVKATAVLVHVRLFRAWRMISLLMKAPEGRQAHFWNRVERP